MDRTAQFRLQNKPALGRLQVCSVQKTRPFGAAQQLVASQSTRPEVNLSDAQSSRAESLSSSQASLKGILSMENLEYFFRFGIGRAKSFRQSRTAIVQPTSYCRRRA